MTVVKWDNRQLAATASGIQDKTLNITNVLVTTLDSISMIHALSVKSDSQNTDVSIVLNDGSNAYVYEVVTSETYYSLVDLPYPFPLPKGWTLSVVFANVPNAESVYCHVFKELVLPHSRMSR